jgi:hypothetical protein
MTGLLLLNLGYLVAGVVLLWGLGALESVGAAVRLAGIAFLLGVAAVVLLTLDLSICGIGVRASLGLSFALILASGVALGARRHARMHPLRVQLDRRWLAGIIFGVPVAVYFGYVCELAPKLGVWEPDAVTTWSLRAKSLYFFNGLDVSSLRSSGAFAYPLFESMLQGLAFVALGKADDLAFHVQFAILLIAFVASVVGLASYVRCPPWIAWPFAALFAIAPDSQSRGLSPLADLTLDYFFALGAVLLALWLERRQPWLLVGASTFLAVAISTKREGLMLAAVAFAVGLVVAWRAGRLRRAAPVALGGACALLTFVPWRVWVAMHGSATDVGNLSPSTLQVHTSQLAPAAGLLARRTFTYHSWFLLVPLAAALAVLALLATSGPARRLAVSFAAIFVLSFVGFVAVWWLVPDLATATNQEQPAARLIGALATLSVLFAPLLASALVPLRLRAAGDRDRAGERVGRTDERAAVTVDLR